MNIYEITYLFDSSLSLEEAKSYQEKIKEMIKKAGGETDKEQSPSKKTLAYPIKKKEEAYLSCFDFKIEEEGIKKITSKIKEEEEILRYLLIKKPIFKNKEEGIAGKRRSLKPQDKIEIEEEPAKEKPAKPEKRKLSDIDEKIEEIL